jgi:hypothetical protein
MAARVGTGAVCSLAGRLVVSWKALGGASHETTRMDDDLWFCMLPGLCFLGCFNRGFMNVFLPNWQLVHYDGSGFQWDCASKQFLFLTNYQGENMDYHYVTHSIGGFIQQLAVCYLQRGYWFYVSGEIPPEKDPTAIDRKLLAQYEINLSKYQRCRRKKEGQANIQYLRYQHRFLLLATNGMHSFFEQEKSAICDARRIPMQCFGYSLKYQKGHALVSLAKGTYRNLEAYFLESAVHRQAKTLAWELRSLPFEPYAPVYRQLFSIWKGVNEVRRQAGFELLPLTALRRKRRIYRPFEPAEPVAESNRAQGGEHDDASYHPSGLALD